MEVMKPTGNSNSATSAAFLRQLRAQHTKPPTVVWDNAPATEVMLCGPTRPRPDCACAW